MDLKRLYTADTPKFRRGDNVIIIFNFYDDGKEFSLSSATRAEMKQKTSNGNIITTECEFINYKGKRAVKFDVEAVAMVEKGYLNLLLTVYDGFDAISIQPFNVFIYDDYMGGADSFIDLIQELQRLIENMILDMNNAIKLSEKGVPNGVATLDGNGKVPLIQMPDEFNAFIEHIAHTFYKDGVHGLRIDEDGNAMYKDDNGDWHYMGTGGGSHTEILNAEIKVVDSIATITWEGVPTAVIRKWALGDRNIQYFLLDGNSFTGDTFPVSSIGIHTLYYRDSNGIDYVKTFEVDMSMMNRPNVDIDIDDGYVTVTPPTGLGISIKKWSKGSRNVAHFQYNGTVFTGNTFEVTEIGIYTVYIKTTNGLEYVYEFEVTEDMLKPVDNTPPIIAITKTPAGWTNKNVAVKVSITDESAIRIQRYRIGYFSEQETMQNGSNLNTANTLTFTSSDYLCIYAEDIHGNKSFERFNINNIDKVNPTAVYSESYNNSSNTSTITIKGEDYNSGIDYIELPNGSKVYSNTATYSTSTVGDFKYKVADRAGNIVTLSGTVKGSIVRIAGDYGSMMVLYKNGDVYSNLSDSTVGMPTERIDSSFDWYRLSIRGVKDIALGYNYSAILTNQGRVYSTGSNNGVGQLGLGDISPRDNYTIIPSLTNVTEINISGNATYFKSGGKWYGCGGSWGQFAVGHTNYITTPTLIGTSPSGKIISDVDFGESRALYKLSDNKIYGAGNNMDNALGFPHTQSNYQYPNLTDSTSFNSLGATKLFKISQASIVVLNDNSVYLTGNYKVNTPTKITGLPIGQSVDKVILENSLFLIVLGNGDVYQNTQASPSIATKMLNFPSNIVHYVDSKGDASRTIIGSGDNKIYRLNGDVYEEYTKIPVDFQI